MIVVIGQPLLYPPGMPTEGTESILIFIQLVVEILRYPVSLGHVGPMRGYLAPLVLSLPASSAPRALVRCRALLMIDIITGPLADLLGLIPHGSTSPDPVPGHCCPGTGLDSITAGRTAVAEQATG